MSKTNKKQRRRDKVKKKTDQRPIERFAPCQIYLITPPRIDDLAAFAKTLESTLAAAPVACLQIRLKDMARDDILKAAEILIPIAHQYGTDVLINDDPQIALDTGADGVHLGQLDMDINLAKNLLGEDAIIGVTCHNSKELAFSACSGEASYVAFGAVYDSITKPGAPRAALEIFTWWQEAIETPSVAIGGITPDNALAVIQAGADFIAASSGVWDWPAGPQDAVARLHQLCSPPLA